MARKKRHKARNTQVPWWGLKDRAVEG